MRLVLAAVGRLRPALREAADDYLARIGRYARIEEREVREAARAPSVAAALAAEAERLAVQLPDAARLVVLERTAAPWSSEQLAQHLDRWRLEARPVALVVGGSHGLAPALVGRAEARWSFGPLTLPHELARVVALEQLYRGFTILRREPYHK
ncbi:MAG: 23S rRNA (pseudouridine(1915)-N(3))-methyltransferase RlmH [Gemmatimonadales bacterium]|jgi:23S rRNA (pseudouridine1915-N3)-methyltransferase|nr:23S rRNA (pseudouridine(1915)-N(3))-methyltransferase RlmH [Gemmatimonadales bacterium]